MTVFLSCFYPYDYMGAEICITEVYAIFIILMVINSMIKLEE